eukprot:TRINITY_DN3236_c0_g1_i8.p1 TRINITY_DN3236_c0_g1~~TRINITY_DN3236_c0_g1_i8.p1  ORF type:complete len:114 (+),score=25.61 TRINITY_DN3236_c0_g1_i8:40-381(+)
MWRRLPYELRCSTQQICLLSWRENWTQDQVQLFNQTIVDEYVTSADQSDLLDGLENFHISGDSNTMFSCQLRLFRSWYKAWSPQDKQTFLRTLAAMDPPFLQFLQDRNIDLQL